MPERYAWHIFREEHFTTEAEVKTRFSRFTCIVVIPALDPAKYAKLREWLPQAYILAAEVNAMRVQIPADGSEPQWAYGQEIKRTFPEASLWKDCCTGKYVTDGNPQSVNYSLSAQVIDWWRTRVRAFLNISHGIYQDDSASEIPDWLVQKWSGLGLVDDDGDGWPSKPEALANIYYQKTMTLTAAIRASHPGILIANTGTARMDANLHGISIEISGIGAEAAAEAFKAQYRVSRIPRLSIAWCKNQEELDGWRAVAKGDTVLEKILVGIESSFTDWR